MPAAQHRRWTAAEVRQLIADNPLHTPRYELVDGELIVTPSPAGRHQFAIRALVEAMLPYLRRTGAGDLLWSPFDIELEEESVLQPDIFVVPLAEGRRLRREMPGRALMLAIEILSPGSARHDRGRKRRYYQRNAVPEYWIVDLDSRLVERWRPADDRPEILTETMEWQPADAAGPLVIDLCALFVEALDG
ncbi:MAG: Uma2 family endonuclease [Gemmatimonadales bacterium]